MRPRESWQRGSRKPRPRNEDSLRTGSLSFADRFFGDPNEHHKEHTRLKDVPDDADDIELKLALYTPIRKGAKLDQADQNTKAKGYPSNKVAGAKKHHADAMEENLDAEQATRDV